MSERTGRGGAVIGVAVLVVGFGFAGGMSAQARAAGANDDILRVPAGELRVEETTVTVSVLEDSMAPVRRVFELCESIGERRGSAEESELEEHLRALCRAAERLSRGFDESRHELSPGPYVVTVPLEAPRGTLRAVLWKARSLDDAVTFVELLRAGALKAVTVNRRLPDTSTREFCFECPIQDLVFSAEGVKDVLKPERGP